MGCSGAGCSEGLLGTICFATGGAACFAVSHRVKKRSATSVENAVNSEIFLFFILDSSRNENQPDQSLLSRFLARRFFDTRAEIFEHYHGGIASGRAGHGTSRMRSSAGLIQAGNGHTMLRPSGHRAHGRGLRGALRTSVRAAVPKMRIHAL